MNPLQNYAEQMGGFNFEFSQRYHFILIQKPTPYIKKCHQAFVI